MMAPEAMNEIFVQKSSIPRLLVLTKEAKRIIRKIEGNIQYSETGDAITVSSDKSLLLTREQVEIAREIAKALGIRFSYKGYVSETKGIYEFFCRLKKENIKELKKVTDTLGIAFYTLRNELQRIEDVSANF